MHHNYDFADKYGSPSGFTRDIGSVIAQDNYIPDIGPTFQNLMLKLCPIKLPLPGGWGWGVTKWINFPGSSWYFPNFWPLKLPPTHPTRGVGVNFFIDFLGSSWHFLDFWIVDPIKPPWDPLGVGWVKFVWARMIPGSIRACVPNLFAVRRSCRKKGGYRHKDTHKGTRHLYIVEYVTTMHTGCNPTLTDPNASLNPNSSLTMDE